MKFFLWDWYVILFNYTNFDFNVLYNDILIDALFSSNLFVSSFSKNTDMVGVFYTLDMYYDYLIQNNWSYITLVNNTGVSMKYLFTIANFAKFFFKLNIVIFIVYMMFFFSYLENYMKQVAYLNNLTRLFILNESEKEVGPMDDFIFFAVLFVLTLSSFIIVSLIVLLFNSSIFIWTFASLLLVSMLILTVPVNLFMDFGIAFLVYISGSASSSSLIKELLFDVISTATVFISFVIQNIRFLFIFSAIFELLEWVFANNSNLFLVNYFINKNIFINFSNFDDFLTMKNFNLIIVNSILFMIFYFYYFLHLLFLLLVQITIYVGISIWLFFFLYSTKFLGKYEKFFVFKR